MRRHALVWATINYQYASFPEILTKWNSYCGFQGGGKEVLFKYLRSKPVSPNNCNSMFIPSLLLQPAQFPSRLWCIWKGVTEKCQARKVTADSQGGGRDTSYHHMVNERARATTLTNCRKEREVNACSELKPVKHFLLPNEDLRSPGFFPQGSQAYLSSMPISCNGGDCFLTAFLMLQFSQDFSSLWHRIAQKNRMLAPRRNSQWLRKKVVISIGRWTTKRENAKWVVGDMNF